MNVVGSYWSWLASYTVDDHHVDGYSSILGLLFDTEFYALTVGDEARIQDGIDLRDQFCKENRVDLELINAQVGPCSVLEMMLGLSIRIENDIACDPRNNNYNPQFWFWLMMRNLGLEDMDDDFFRLDEAEYILQVFLNRHQESNGRGGLFISLDGRSRFDKKDIWQQLCHYLNENPDLLNK